MSEESATIEALAPYPQEFDEGFDETEGEGPYAVPFKDLHSCRGKAEFLDALGNWYRYTEASLDALNAKQKPFLEQMESDRRYLENKLKFIKSQIPNFLQPGPESKHLSESVRLVYSRSVAAKVVDAEKVPFDLCKTTVSPDIAKCKELLLEGKEVPGMELEERWNLQIKPGSLRALTAEKKKQKEIENDKATENINAGATSC